MGGNLFKLGRKPRKEYLVIENTVRSYLNETIGEENYRIPRYYNKKTTFGDLDILVNDKFRNNKEFKTNFAKDLGSTFTKNAGVVVSNNIMNFQVDLFFFNEKYLQMASDFMDYNIGNFIGKIAKRFNLKYGDHGLYYVYRRDNNEHNLSELHITQDMSQILSFFGLDYEKWKSGFENNIESFEWLIKSKYFSTYTYFKPTANNKKRVEFETFMTWLKTHNITQDFDSTTLSKQEKNDLISNHFNIDINGFLNNEDLKEARHDVIYEKYNGDIVMNLTNLKGKELGKFISNFKNHITSKYNKDFNEFVYINTKELITEEILKFINLTNMNNYIYDILFNSDEELIEMFNTNVYFRESITSLFLDNDPVNVIKNLCTIISNNGETIENLYKNNRITYNVNISDFTNEEKENIAKTLHEIMKK